MRVKMAAHRLSVGYIWRTIMMLTNRQLTLLDALRIFRWPYAGVLGCENIDFKNKI